MTSMDKAAIAFSIAITAIGVGIAFTGASLPTADVTQPSVQTNPSLAPANTGSAGDAMANDASMMDDAMMDDAMMDDAMMDDAMMDDTSDAMQNDGSQAGPATHRVEVPVGSGVQGCEETNECFIPADITINAGDTVEWDNVDTLAHTVTAGSLSAGTTGEFDSSLFLAGTTYSFTFEEPGTYDYFCIVHPWMAGSVTVN